MSGWLWSDSASQQKALEKQQKLAAKQDAAVVELRSTLAGPEGQKAARQLVQGGELSSAEEMTGDAYLRRWLAAREWDVPLTASCMMQHAGWRAHTMPHGYVDEAWISEPLGDEKTCLQGCDHQGRAFAIIRVAKHLPRKDVKPMKLFTAYTMDAMVALCDPEKNPGRRLVSMFDMTNCSMANMDVAAMRMVLGLLGQHYVERLDAMYFFNPPLVFWGLWNTFKALLPDVTRSKIKVIDPSDLKELRAAVPAHVLPREYGGEAELVLVQDAVRRHKLPPYPHLPELGSQPCAPPPAELEACDDAAAAISDEPAAKVGAQQPGGSAAVSLQASAQG